MSSPSLSGPPPQIRQTPAKPRITINIPPQHGYPAISPYPSTAPFTAHSNSTVPGAPQWPGAPYANPFTGANMYKQFEGFCDFTMASAKSGLGVGEKSAFYIYEKFSTWSRKWFTHIFLFLCIFLYSLAGAFLFMAVEGPPQQKAFADFREIKSNFSKSLYALANGRHNSTSWQSEVEKRMKPFLQEITTLYKKGYFDKDQTNPSGQWNVIWNAMFYCGTVFTTIVEKCLVQAVSNSLNLLKMFMYNRQSSNSVLVSKSSQKDESSESSRSSPHYLERNNTPSKRTIDMNNHGNHKESDSRELSKLEINLRRFEEERRKFELEKRKFDKEKRDMDKIRYRRLEDFERKRMERKKDEARHPDDVSKLYKVFDTGSDTHRPVKHDPVTDKILGKICPILKKPKDPLPPAEPVVEDKVFERTKSPSTAHREANQVSLENFENPEITQVCDDYESSTAISSSSREGDFDDIDFSKLPVVDDHKHLLDLTVTSSQVKEVSSKLSWFSRFFGKKTSKKPKEMIKNVTVPIKDVHLDENMSTVSLLKFFFIESRVVWRQLLSDHALEWEETKLIRNKCIADLIVMTIFCGMGGMIFRFVEGAFENFYKCGVRRVKRDFVDYLWTTSHNLREDDWKTAARSKLRKFEEELHAAHEAGMTSYSGMKAWTFINGIIYCMTVVTTIGYGHIAPSTSTGRAITIVYAIIGIPMFLILLADFGKLFTRGIKFMWAYVRRLYYTGSCRKVRKQAQVQDVLRGMNMAYEIATFRRPSMMMKAPDIEEGKEEEEDLPSSHLAPPSNQESPITPMPPDVDAEIDDEFNLPISLAFFLLLAYIFCGAAVYTMWEDWTFFEACYFVFISMSTIGFGDYVPNHPAFMMMSILYLIFGLALTSMCINVVQVKLSDSFRQASAKIGATIGLSMAEEEARASQSGTPTHDKDDIPSVHSSSLKIPNDGNPTVVIDEPPPLLPKKSDLLAADNDKATKKSKK